MTYLSLARDAARSGNLVAASTFIDEAEAAGEPRAEALVLRGGLHALKRHWDHAKPYFFAAAAEQPASAIPLLNLANVQFELGEWHASIANLRACIARDRNLPKAWLILGANHLLLAEVPEALACYERAEAMAPENHECHIGLASALSTMGEDDAALHHAREANRLHPEGDFPDARALEAFTLLRMGRWAEAWPVFEARWALPGRRVATWDYRGRPLFEGTLEDMRGKRVMIREEMGYGDSIQFSRFLPVLAEVAEAIIYEASPPMLRLMQTVPCISEFFVRNQPAPPFDYQTSLMSLPLLFGTTPETCPPPTMFRISGRAESEKKGRVVGLCSIGGTRPTDPHANQISMRRNMNEQMFHGLYRIAKEHGIYIQSLQYQDMHATYYENYRQREDQSQGTSAEGQEKRTPREAFVRALPVSEQRNAPCGLPSSIHGPLALPQMPFWDSQPGTETVRADPDWRDTAEIVSALDLVITVDTAVAHLAASLGVPTWVLSRFDSCWRWKMTPPLTLAPTVWYPSMRVIRQAHINEWAPVVSVVEEELRKWITQQ